MCRPKTLSILITFLFCQETQTVNITVEVGNTATLPCHTTFDVPVDWRHQKNATIEEKYVCVAATETGVPNCEDYHRWPMVHVNVSTPGDYTLTIDNVTVNDSGLYHCVEEQGAGKRHTFQLHVEKTNTKTGKSVNLGDSLTHVVTIAANVAAAIIAVVVLTIVFVVRFKRRQLSETISVYNNEEQLFCLQQLQTDVNREFMCQIPNWRSTSDLPQGAALTDCFPESILGGVLLKCIVPLAVPEMKKTPQADVVAITTLGDVSSAWNKLVIVQLHENKRKLRSEFERVCYPYLFKPRFLRNILDDVGHINQATVIGVAHLDNKIFIAFESSYFVKVFDDRPPYAERPAIKTDTKEISDIVAWKMKASIFIAGFDHYRIRQVTVDGRPRKWPLRKSLDDVGKSRPCSLSAVTDKLLVTYTNRKLKVYGLNGTRQESFDLDKAIDVHYVYATPSESITYCVRVSDESEGDELAKNPRITRVFTQRFHVSFDGERSGFLCDQDKNVVVLTTPDLEEQRVLLNSEFGDLRHPTKLCYLEQHGELLVCAGKNVKVYRFIFPSRSPIPQHLVHNPPSSYSNNVRTNSNIFACCSTCLSTANGADSGAFSTRTSSF